MCPTGRSACVPSPQVRPSQLVTSSPSYVRRSIVTIMRTAVIYRPFLFFASVGVILIVAGGSLNARSWASTLSAEGKSTFSL